MDNIESYTCAREHFPVHLLSLVCWCSGCPLCLMWFTQSDLEGQVNTWSHFSCVIFHESNESVSPHNSEPQAAFTIAKATLICAETSLKGFSQDQWPSAADLSPEAGLLRVCWFSDRYSTKQTTSNVQRYVSVYTTTNRTSVFYKTQGLSERCVCGGGLPKPLRGEKK